MIRETACSVTPRSQLCVSSRSLPALFAFDFFLYQKKMCEPFSFILFLFSRLKTLNNYMMSLVCEIQKTFFLDLPLQTGLNKKTGTQRGYQKEEKRNKRKKKTAGKRREER